MSSHLSQSPNPCSQLHPRRIAQYSLLLFSLGCLSACTVSDAQSTAQSSRSKGDRPAVSVVMATANRQTVPQLFRTTGTVQAYSTVSVQAQVAGQIMGVYLREGQAVQTGDLLFKLDSRELQAALDQAIANRAKALAQVTQAKASVLQAEAQVKQAKATVAKEAAQASNADLQAQRYDSLLAQGAVSREQVDQFRTNAEAQRATVAAEQSNVGSVQAAVESAKANLQSALAAVQAADAAVDAAKIQLSYSSIYAPINGQLGKLNVNQGNLVEPNSTTPLVVISQIHPIYVEFAIPQRLLPDLKQKQAQGQLRVEAKSAQDIGAAAQGELVFVDSGVDVTTGTIKLKAKFDNANGQLTPGQFVNLVLRLSQQPNAIVVPAAAIQAGQKGSFVYVVQSDQKAELRPVTVGQTINGLTVVKTGLEEGEQVVVDGQFNLTPGAAVHEKATSESPSPLSPDPSSRKSPNPSSNPSSSLSPTTP